MKHWFLWLWMLNKRLYKKASFLLLLAILPLAMVSLSAVAKEDRGFVHIVLAQEDERDPISNEIIDSLKEERSLLRFSTAESPQAAIEAVKHGKADGAWIFPADMERQIQAFAAPHSDRAPFIKVLEREDDLFTRLSREKLSSALYPYCARAKYLNLTQSFPELEGLSEEQLMEAYETVPINETLFSFARPDHTENTSPSGGDYLTAPARGFLAILTLLCGMAAAMYYMEDAGRGTFAHVPMRKRGAVAFACILIALLNIAAMVFIALWASGLGVALWIELLGALLFAIACAEFCLILMRLIKSIRLFGALIPIWILGMLVVCPVFMDYRQLSALRLLLPPTYFINIGHDARYLIYLLIYILIGGLLCFIIELLPKKKI